MAFREDEMNAMISNDTTVGTVTKSDQVQEFNYNNNDKRDEPTTLLSLLNKGSQKTSHDLHANVAENSTASSKAVSSMNSMLHLSTDLDLNVNDEHDAHLHHESEYAANVKNKTIASLPVQDQPAVAVATTATKKRASEQTATSQQMAFMLSEMRNMRTVIESQLTAISWANIQQREPIKTETLSMLLAAGFSPALSRYLVEKLPENLDNKKATAWVKYILGRNLNTIENETEVLDQGGVFALIGPTGVGKTTTTAKLAARYVMKHGTQNLGLITTDAYRVGGHEQLRIYGKILGVMVHAVKDEADLRIALNELKNKHTILIDTVGVSQRDRMVTEQIAMLSSTKTPIKKLLCLNATNTGETLTDVIQAYKGKGLDGCIITKLDEAATIGNALDVIIREKLKLFYTANGQRVPEDINLANKVDLINLALSLKSSANKPFQFLADELPFVMGNTANAVHSSQSGEINHV
jgi:flagellar biosynthesis protein FlhF